MKMRRVVLFSFLAVCGLLAAACDSKKPLSDPEKAKADNRLIGAWRMQTDKGDVQYCHVGADEHLPKGVLRCVWIEQRRDHSISHPLETIVFPTTLGGKTYLNVGLFDTRKAKGTDTPGLKPEQIRAYFLYQYQVDGNAIVLRRIDDGEKKKAIRAGALKGNSGGLLEETTEDLAAYVSAHADALFPKVTARYELVK